MRVMSFILVLFSSALIEAQDPRPRQEASSVDPAAAVARLRQAFVDVVKLGKSAEKPILKLRRRLKVKPAVSLMRVMSKSLRNAKPPATPSDAAAIGQACQQFADALDAVIVLGARGVEPVAAAANVASGFEKTFLEKVRDRLYVQVAYAEIRSHFIDGKPQGTFDGMFPETAALGPKGARAMLDLFVDLDQETGVRSHAGEGVAQLGSKEDIPTVRDIHGDELEEASLRTKAMYVLARLGDTSAFDERLKALDGKLEEIEQKRDKARETLSARTESYRKLESLAAPTDAQKAEMESLKKTIAKARQEWVNAVFACGNGYVQRAGLFQEIRQRKKTEECYRIALLDNWLKIGRYLQGAKYRARVSNAFYNLSCVLSLQHSKASPRLDAAMESLENAFRWGYASVEWAQRDGDLENLRKDPRFGKLLTDVNSGAAMKRWMAEAEAARKKAEAERKGAGNAASDKSGDQ